MPGNAGLIEPSFQDAIQMIAASEELPEQAKRHWMTSLRQFAKAMDRPLEIIPARYSAVRNDLAKWHHVPAGLTAKTVMNHRSNVKGTLLWLAREKGIPEHGAQLTAAWEELRAKVKDALIRSRLSSFIRYCSANNVTPAEVDEITVDKFIDYRARCGKPADPSFRRLLARAWNVGNIPGWPKRRLGEPPVKSTVEIGWEEFPKRLQKEVDRYLEGLTRIRKSRAGRHIKPLRPATIHGRRAELQAAARMAVKIGVPIEKLDSLRAMLEPDMAEKILDAYWERNGKKPKLYTIDLARRFVAIARETKCLNDKDCERLQDMWRRLYDERPPVGLTNKNLEFLRKVLTPGVWGRVLKLPMAMMAEVRRCQCQHHAPIRAAVIAQLAVAIAILAVAPVRLANLTSIRLGPNLHKPDGPDSDYWLHFTPEDTKNNVRLEFVFKEYLTRLIDEYVQDFWPTLLRGRKEDYLFPGLREGAKGKISFSVQISKRIYRATGLKMTVHQFRHAAGAIILKNRPGEFELVRQILGHRSIATTMQCYVGLETIQASEIFTTMVMDEIDANLTDPDEP
jgi:Phage integrase family